MAFLLAAGAAALVCSQAQAHVQAAPVWLCHPGQKANPCTRSLSFTAVNADARVKGYGVGARKAQPIDCFYVYPSVSTEHRGNSDLEAGDRGDRHRAAAGVVVLADLPRLRADVPAGHDARRRQPVPRRRPSSSTRTCSPRGATTSRTTTTAAASC